MVEQTEIGSAILVTLMLVVLLGAISGGLVLLVRTETAISRNYREALRLRYAADAGIALAIWRLRTQPDWSALLDAAPGVWTVIEHGRLSDLIGVPTEGTDLVMVSVADDADDPDGDPAVDTNGRLLVRAEVTGPRGARAVVQATVGRVVQPVEPPVQLLDWRELP